MPDFSRYRLGAVPSPPDDRDFVAKAVTPARADALPAVVLLSHLPPVWDQGPEGTCVAHALLAVLGQALLKSGRVRELSRRDSYEGAREVSPVGGEGAHPRAALEYARKFGICLEATWPYKPYYAGTPGPTAPAERPLSRVGAYVSVAPTVADLRAQLHLRQAPLMAMIAVTAGFDAPDADGVARYKGAERGFHEVALVGYDHARGAFRVRNSWGTGWGQGGYAWLPYTYPIVEAWAASALLADPAQPPPPPLPWWEQMARWFGGL